MSVKKAAGFACVVLALSLTGCSGEAKQEPFESKVTLLGASPDCDADDRCWLPIQFGNGIVNAQTVSLRDQWPLKGDTITVLCETDGQSIKNLMGNESDTWYGVLVPADKLDPSAEGSAIAAPNPDDGYIGYVSALWVTGSANPAPDC